MESCPISFSLAGNLASKRGRRTEATGEMPAKGYDGRWLVDGAWHEPTVVLAKCCAASES